jgi:hypothetical protein
MKEKAEAPGCSMMTTNPQPKPTDDVPAPASLTLDGRTFRVGARDYTVHVTPGPLLIDGREASGATLEENGEILIAPHLAPASAVRVMLRELARAWTFETGEPATAEDWLDLTATVALAALRELLPASTWGELAGCTTVAGEVDHA